MFIYDFIPYAKTKSKQYSFHIYITKLDQSLYRSGNKTNLQLQFNCTQASIHNLLLLT